MKITYILPRYHTNLVHCIDDLLSAGHEVKIYVQHINQTENHANIKPIKIKESVMWKILEKLFSIKGENYLEKKKIHWFIPDIFFLWNEIKRNKPDLLILRERNITSLISNIIAKKLKTKSIIYNQTPIYIKKPITLVEKLKRKIKETIFKAFFPRIRITPVEFATYDDYLEYRKNPEKFEKDNEAIFVPLIVERDQRAFKREYFQNNTLRILDVGKYRDYKNHFLLVDAIYILYHELRVKNIQITIIGQVTNSQEEEYYQKLKRYIAEKNLSSIFNLLKNIPHQEMRNYYLTHDVLVLASKREIFGFAVLEAMANGMVVLSSSQNGSATYIKDCGGIFSEKDKYQLAKLLNELSKDKNKVEEIGQRALHTTLRTSKPGIYSENIQKIISSWR